MTTIAHIISNICTNRMNTLIKGFDRSTNLITLKGLLGFPRLKRAVVSGLDRCRLSLGMCRRIFMWSVGIFSRLRKDFIPKNITM